MMIKTMCTYIMAAIWGFAVLFAGSAYADLSITPTLIHFEDGDRYKDVTLINTSEETKTYEMSWKFLEMQETGASYKPVEGSVSAFDVSKYVFYTPRRVTIPAKGSQKIRMAFRRPKEVPNGDYSAHLLFSPSENPEINTEKRQAQSAAAGVSVKVGYSIPVIVRAGQFVGAGDIGRINLTRSTRNKLTVNVPVKRPAGDYGVIGAVKVYHLPAGGGEELVGEVVNANVFTEIDQRIIPVALNKEVSGGQLKVVLLSGKKNNDSVFDTETFPLN